MTPLHQRGFDLIKQYGFDLFLALIPCLVLFLRPFALHYEDWENWVWVGAFQADSLWLNGTFASVIHTVTFVGYTGPIFYGSQFFRVLGLLAIPFGSGIAVRLLAWFFFFAQIRGARLLFEKSGVPSAYAALLGAIQAWSIYQMTNLYNRSALTEFFAFQALAVGFLYLLSGLINPDNAQAQKRELGLGIAGLTFAAGSHPITALLGGLFGVIAAPLVLLGFLRIKIHRSTWPWILVFGMLAVGILSPWLFSVAQYKNELRISDSYARMIRFEFDSFGNRLLPFPYDPRTWSAAASSVPTPWLDAQINMPLLVIFVTLLALGWKSVAQMPRRFKIRFWAVGLICAALTASLIYLSVEGSEIESVAVLFRVVQFEYRLINYVNLSLIVGVVILLQMLSQCLATSRSLQTCLQRIVLVVFGASLLLTLEKNLHGNLGVIGTSQLYSGPSVRHASAHQIKPASFINILDYTTPALLPDVPAGNPLSQEIALPLNSGFNNVGKAVVVLTQTTRVGTNVLTFPWNHLTLDGRDLALSDLVPGSDKSHLGLMVPAGAHEIGYRLEKPRTYRRLEVLRWICGLAWIGVLLYFLVGSIYGLIFSQRSARSV